MSEIEQKVSELHSAALACDEKTVLALVKAGADLNASKRAFSSFPTATNDALPLVLTHCVCASRCGRADAAALRRGRRARGDRGVPTGRRR
eukprot:2317997-Rhodomonas_salina.2